MTPLLLAVNPVANVIIVVFKMLKKQKMCFFSPKLQLKKGSVSAEV